MRSGAPQEEPLAPNPPLRNSAGWRATAPRSEVLSDVFQRRCPRGGQKWGSLARDAPDSHRYPADELGGGGVERPRNRFACGEPGAQRAEVVAGVQLRSSQLPFTYREASLAPMVVARVLSVAPVLVVVSGVTVGGPMRMPVRAGAEMFQTGQQVQGLPEQRGNA